MTIGAEFNVVGDYTPWAWVGSGDTLVGGGTLTAPEGTKVVNLHGFEGSADDDPNTTAVFQTYQNSTFPEGTSLTLTGKGYVSSGDPINVANTSGYLFFKFFADGFAYIGIEKSAVTLNFTTTADTWLDMTVTATVPTGATIVQAGMDFLVCEGGTNDTCSSTGSVYFDDLVLVQN